MEYETDVTFKVKFLGNLNKMGPHVPNSKPISKHITKLGGGGWACFHGVIWTAAISIHQSIYIPKLIYGQKLLVVAEGMSRQTSFLCGLVACCSVTLQRLAIAG